MQVLLTLSFNSFNPVKKVPFTPHISAFIVGRSHLLKAVGFPLVLLKFNLTEETTPKATLPG